MLADLHYFRGLHRIWTQSRRNGHPKRHRINDAFIILMAKCENWNVDFSTADFQHRKGNTSTSKLNYEELHTHRNGLLGHKTASKHIEVESIWTIFSIIYVYLSLKSNVVFNPTPLFKHCNCSRVNNNSVRVRERTPFISLLCRYQVLFSCSEA